VCRVQCVGCRGVLDKGREAVGGARGARHEVCLPLVLVRVHALSKIDVSTCSIDGRSNIESVIDPLSAVLLVWSTHSHKWPGS